ncbi:hypothetical protein [Stackebrandtia soli]|uniref:hypothetical protein n=1 Tax=Stackebrandtia soli TaxID=1892856 RepID=UPI0039EA8A55
MQIVTGAAVVRARAAVDRHRPDPISTHPLGLTQCRECGHRWPSAVWTPPERRGCAEYRAARVIVDAAETRASEAIVIEWRAAPKRRRWFRRRPTPRAVVLPQVAYRAVGIARVPVVRAA